jgi:hypothetical protein
MQTQRPGHPVSGHTMEQWLSFLNEATEQIGKDLDPARIAAGCCAAAVPFLADYAAVYAADALFTDGIIPAGSGTAPPVRLMASSGAPDPGPPAAHGHLSDLLRAKLPRLTDTGVLLVPLRTHGRSLGFAVLAREHGRDGFD